MLAGLAACRAVCLTDLPPLQPPEGASGIHGERWQGERGLGGSHGASAAERLVSREFSAFFSRRKKLVGLEMSASESRQCVRAGQWAASWDRAHFAAKCGIMAGACDWGFLTPILTFT